MGEFEKIKVRAEAAKIIPFRCTGRQNTELLYTHIHSDIPWLIGMVERLRTEKNELKKEISRMRGRTVS